MPFLLCVGLTFQNEKKNKHAFVFHTKYFCSLPFAFSLTKFTCFGHIIAEMYHVCTLFRNLNHPGGNRFLSVKCDYDCFSDVLMFKLAHA